MVRKIIAFLVCGTLCLSLAAQRVDRVYTNTGEVYIGFIAEQVPGKFISVYAEEAHLKFNLDEVVDLREDDRPYASLSRTAKEFFHDDTLNVRLSSFEWQNEWVDNAYVKNKEEYISFENKTYKIPWDKITRTSKVFDVDTPYGLRDIVGLNTEDELIGGIVEQTIGRSMKIRTSDGAEHNVLMEEVVSVRTEKIDPESSIWDQSLLLDRLFVAGMDDPVEGLIISRVMGRELTILEHGTTRERVFPLVAIKKYQKFWNKDYVSYSPPEPVVVDTTKILRIDGVDVNGSEMFDDMENYYVSDPSGAVQVYAGQPFRVELFNVEHGDSVRVFRTTQKKCKEKSDIDHFNKKYPAISRGASPENEFHLKQDANNHDICDVVIAKEGQYILTVNGFDNVIVIEVKKI